MKYKKPYRKSYIKYLIGKLKFSKPKIVYDLVLVIPEYGRGWILEAICKEIAAYYPHQYCFAHDIYNLPHSKAYYFAHYSFFPVCLKHNPHIWGSKKIVFHTHPSDIGISKEEFLFTFNKADKIICMNSMFAHQLLNEGIKKEILTYIIAGADKDLFYSHERGKGAVGFSLAYYERKDPDRILNIIKSMPHRQFILLGKNWEKYDKYAELIALENLKYITADYKSYPEFYSMMDVYVSPAVLEGGPIPLIETMMSNVVPVASMTGFAPDIIRDKENGFLFKTDTSVEEICKLIDEAYLLKVDIRKTVIHLTWENFSKNIQRYL